MSAARTFRQALPVTMGAALVAGQLTEELELSLMEEVEEVFCCMPAANLDLRFVGVVTALAMLDLKSLVSSSRLGKCRVVRENMDDRGWWNGRILTITPTMIKATH